MREQTAQLNYLHIAPRKVRLLTDTLKGLPAKEAEAQLLLRPQRTSRPLLKLLRSAVASAKHNQKISEESLVVHSVRVDPGPILKRFLPRAMGRATSIHKKMSHVTLVLHETTPAKMRFTINPPVTKEVKPAKKATQPVRTKTGDEKADRPQARDGFFRRFFRRKAV